MPFNDYPGFDTPQDDTVIWHFMNFPKFCSLLSLSSLFFCRADRFDDPWEGVWPKHYYDTAYWKDKLTAAFPWMTREEMQQQIDINVSYFESSYRDRGHMGVTCWHENQNEAESFWKLYSNPTYGVAIKTRVGLLKKSIEQSRWNVHIGKVTYIDFEKAMTFDQHDHLAAIRIKRLDFAHEKEVRAVVWKDPRLRDHDRDKKIFSGNGVYVDCDLNTLIESITVSPMAEDWFYNVVVDVAKRYGITKARCLKSDLYEKPDYV